jgi:cell division protein FtsB
MNLQVLRRELEALEAEIGDLRSAGSIPYPADFVLDSSTAKGRIYYRRRARGADGKPGRSEQISSEMYSQLQGELDRGKQIHKLEKQRSRLAAKIDRLVARVAALGGAV